MRNYVNKPEIKYLFPLITNIYLVSAMDLIHDFCCAISKIL